MKQFNYIINKTSEFDEVLKYIVKTNHFMDFMRDKNKIYINLRSSKHDNEVFLLILYLKFKSTSQIFRLYKKLRILHRKKQIKDNQIK